MTKKCELTGVLPLKGHNVSHANNKTKRRFLPNLKKISFKSEVLKRNIRLNVSNAALRTVDFKGGLDKFLKTAKRKNLSRRVQKIEIFYNFSKIVIMLTTTQKNYSLYYPFFHGIYSNNIKLPCSISCKIL